MHQNLKLELELEAIGTGIKARGRAAGNSTAFSGCSTIFRQDPARFHLSFVPFAPLLRLLQNLLKRGGCVYKRTFLFLKPYPNRRGSKISQRFQIGIRGL